MRRFRKIALIIAGLLIGLPLAVILLVLVGLNTNTGRSFAVDQINKYAGGSVKLAGLAGHFPDDIKLRDIAILDSQGAWLNLHDVGLRWSPAALLSRHIDISRLTAHDIELSRLPVASAKQSANSKPFSLPHFKLSLAQLSVAHLIIDAPVAGERLAFSVAGHAALSGLQHANMALMLKPQGAPGTYDISAALDGPTIDAHALINEPARGLIAHLAHLPDTPSFKGPISIDARLHGPRAAASLNIEAGIGALLSHIDGTIDLTPQAEQADLTVTLDDLAPYAAIGAVDLHGHTAAHIQARNVAGAIDVVLQDRLDITGGQAPLPGLIGQAAILNAHVTIKNHVVSIEKFGFDGAALHLAATGRIDGSKIALTDQARETDVSLLAPQLTGHVAEAGTMSGSFDHFAVHSQINGVIATKGFASGPFEIDVDAQNLPNLPSGHVLATGSLDNAPLALDADFARDKTGLITTIVNKFDFKSLDAQGHIAYQPGAGLPTGLMHVSLLRLADFASLINMPLSGSIKADFAHQAGQDATLTAVASNIRTNNLQLKAAHIAGRVSDVPANPMIHGTVQLDQFAAPQAAGSAELNIDGPLDHLAMALGASFSQLGDAPARIAARGIVDIGTKSLNLTQFSAASHGKTLLLQGPATIDAAAGMIVHHLALGLDGGRFTLDGMLQPSLNMKASIVHLPLSLAELAAPNMPLSGILNADAALRGSLAAPQGTLNLALVKVHAGRGPASSLPPAGLTAQAILQGRSAQINAALTLGRQADLTVQGTAPLSATGMLNLRISGRTDLRILDPILIAGGTRLTGILTPDLTITGNAKAPQANGTIALDQGSVENIGSGFDLSHIQGLVTASGRRLVLTSLAAQAGDGHVSATGTLDLAPPMPVDVRLVLDKASPVASDESHETLSGMIGLTGALRSALGVKGTVTIDQATIRIPKSLPPSVAKLDIRRPGDKPPAPSTGKPLPLALDLTIRAADKIFIRGDGLFAELAGRLHLGGSAANPVPSGGFKLVRGNISLAGKTLQLTKGTIEFNGNGFSPVLDLEASNVSGNVTSTLALTGTPDKPVIQLSASPPLPSDEVLAHLLYGTGSTNLSPFQAASLAAALASLAGIGGNTLADPLGGVRNALGLDELSIGGGSNGSAPSINAGRYVAPGVYVGAEQAASGQGSKAKVEINLYKGLKLKTEAGTGTGSGQGNSVGVIYQFNY